LFSIIIQVAFSFSGFLIYLFTPSFVLFGFFLAFRNKNLTGFITGIIIVLALSIAFIVTSLYSWLAPLGSYISIEPQGVFQGTTPHYYYYDALVPFLSIFSATTFGLAFSFGWGSEPIVVMSSLVPAVLAYLALFFKKEHQSAYVIFSLLLATAIISFIYFTSLGLTTWMFENIGIFALVPNPDPLSLLQTFAYATPIAATVKGLRKVIVK